MLNQSERSVVRYQSFDALKLLMMFLVIWGHSILWFISYNPIDSVIYRDLNAFHVATFMMISGYFSLSSMGKGIRTFFPKIFMRLIYPCIVWGGIVWICLKLFSLIYDNFQGYGFGAFIEDIYWYGNFWFLRSCFICYCLAYICRRVIKKYWVIVSLICSQLIFTFFVSFMYPCFLIGLLMRENKYIWDKVVLHSQLIIIVFCLMLLFWSKDMWILSHGLPMAISEMEIVDVAKIGFGRLFRLLLGIAGAVSFIVIFCKYLKLHSKKGIVNTFCDWGKYTLELYILQAIIIEMILSRIVNFDWVPLPLYYLMFSPMISVLILIVCVIIIKCIYRSKCLGKFLFYK